MSLAARDRRIAGAALALLFCLSPQVIAQTRAEAPGPTAGSDEAGLELVNLDLLDSRDGFAIPADTKFAPGETVHVYFQVRGYFVNREDQMRISYRVEAVDALGRRFAEPEEGVIAEELAPQDENWMPVVRYSPTIPMYAVAGEYRINVLVKDEMDGGPGAKSVKGHLTLQVQGASMDGPGATKWWSDLTSSVFDGWQTNGIASVNSNYLLKGGGIHLDVVDFRLSKAESAGPPLQPTFSPGDEIWASFHIVGYSGRPDSSFNVESDVSVFNADGKKMVAFEPREVPAIHHPGLSLPAMCRLDLDSTIPSGTYTVVVRVKDLISEETVTIERPFHVKAP